MHFANIKYKTYASPGFGLVLDAPDSWIEGNDETCFQLIDPSNGTEITASAYQNQGLWLEQWANYRFSIIDQGMPYLTCVKPSYGIRGRNVSGIAADYCGVFPDSGKDRYYLVYCLRTDDTLISLTITADRAVFFENEELYRSLLTDKLDIYGVHVLPS
jgi:hypothetical protein